MGLAVTDQLIIQACSCLQTARCWRRGCGHGCKPVVQPYRWAIVVGWWLWAFVIDGDDFRPAALLLSAPSPAPGAEITAIPSSFANAFANAQIVGEAFQVKAAAEAEHPMGRCIAESHPIARQSFLASFHVVVQPARLTGQTMNLQCTHQRGGHAQGQRRRGKLSQQLGIECIHTLERMPTVRDQLQVEGNQRNTQHCLAERHPPSPQA